MRLDYLVLCSFHHLKPSLVPRPLPDFISQIKSGSGLGTRLPETHTIMFGMMIKDYTEVANINYYT